MAQEKESARKTERDELPIERGFPIRQLNDISEKESYGGARQWYRPIYTMHKWWARRLGSVFRAICLYTLVDDPDEIEVYEPGKDTELGEFSDDYDNISAIFEEVSLENPDSLWKLYPKDVRAKDKKILDPFMGGGTSIVEASRFGVECHGRDLNPVAWFVTNEPDDHEADVMNSFWVKQLDCVSCGNTVSLFKDYRVGKGRFENKGKYNVFCPECEEVIVVGDWHSESECSECGNVFVPEDGNVDYSNYVCSECGQRYPITDAIEEQGGFDLKYYSIEYHCSVCDETGKDGSDVKGYKSVTSEDKEIYEEARQEWKQSDNLSEYVPSESIRPGWSTSANQFEGSMSGNGNLPKHGYREWTDMFNDRQLLCYSLLLKEIDSIDNQSAKEYLLLAFSDMLRYRSSMNTYKHGSILSAVCSGVLPSTISLSREAMYVTPSLDDSIRSDRSSNSDSVTLPCFIL